MCVVKGEGGGCPGARRTDDEISCRGKAEIVVSAEGRFWFILRIVITCPGGRVITALLFPDTIFRACHLIALHFNFASSFSGLQYYCPPQ